MALPFMVCNEAVLGKSCQEHRPRDAVQARSPMLSRALKTFFFLMCEDTIPLETVRRGLV